MSKLNARLQQLEKAQPTPDAPAYAVMVDGGYQLYYADGRKELVTDKPARVKCYTPNVSPEIWDDNQEINR